MALARPAPRDQFAPLAAKGRHGDDSFHSMGRLRVGQEDGIKRLQATGDDRRQAKNP
jgi:hypothetical protein